MFNIDIQIYLHCAEIFKQTQKYDQTKTLVMSMLYVSVKLNIVHILFPLLRMLFDSELIL